MGLLTASAVLVHLSDGVIEMHFHYFVMVGVITLYQDWRPFLVAIGYVVLQHGVAGRHLAGVGLQPPGRRRRTRGSGPASTALFILGMSVGRHRHVAAERVVCSRPPVRPRAASWPRPRSWRGSAAGSATCATGDVAWSDRARTGCSSSTPGVGRRARALPRHDRTPTTVAAFDGRRRPRRSTACPSRSTSASSLPDGAVRWLHAPRRGRREWADGRPALRVGHDAGRHRAPAQSEDSLKRHAVAAQRHPRLDRRRHPRRRPRRADHAASTGSSSRCGASREPILDVTATTRPPSAFVLDQLVDPDGFVAKVTRALRPARGRELRRASSSSTGGSFERYSKPQRVGGDDRRPGVELPRRHRAQAARGRARPPGVPRLAHRPRQPGAVPRPRRARPGPRQPHAAAASPCCSSTSTTSRRSTTASATPPATSCSSRWPSACGRACAPPTPPPGSAATSSRCSSRTPTAAARPSTVAEPAARRRCAQPFDVARQGGRIVGASIGIAVRHARRSSDRPAPAQRRPGHVPRQGPRAGTGYEIFEPEMHAAAVERLELEADLRRALERRRVRAALPADRRPRRPGAIVGVEALVRWQHPTRGLLAPGRVHPAWPRRRGLIDELGLQVLEQALPPGASGGSAHPGHRRAAAQRQRLAPPAAGRPPRRPTSPTSLDATGLPPGRRSSSRSPRAR